jgi:hypothetical protein
VRQSPNNSQNNSLERGLLGLARAERCYIGEMAGWYQSSGKEKAKFKLTRYIRYTDFP